MAQLITEAEARALLRLTAETPTSQFQSCLDSATEVIEHFCGPITERTVVEDHDTAVIVLTETPALAVVSVATLAGTVLYGPDDLDLGPVGVLRRLDGGRFGAPVRVTYTVGRTTVPAALVEAAKVIVQHLYRTRLGSTFADRGNRDMSDPIPGLGYAVPNRALELLQGQRLGPVVG